jgi:hypothetical protein
MFLSSLACLGQSKQSLEPPSGSSGRNVPLYPNSHKITIKDSDLQFFLSNILIGGPELQYNSNSNLAWTEDIGTKVQKQFDKLLPDADWRLKEDWHTYNNYETSLWGYGDLQLLIAYFDNLNSEQINDLERKYGIFGLQSGCTMILTYVWDISNPLPSATPTITPIPSLTPTFSPYTEAVIFANQGWQSAGIFIEQGATVTIKVISGQWTGTLGKSPFNTGEGGKYICGKVMSHCIEPLPDFPSDGLIGQIGSPIFGIGNGTDIVAQQAGTLFMRMNDGDPGLFDNDGSLTVKITIEK